MWIHSKTDLSRNEPFGPLRSAHSSANDRTLKCSVGFFANVRNGQAGHILDHVILVNRTTECQTKN